MKPLGQELSQLVAKRPVKELKQRFLDHVAGKSAGMSISQPQYNVIKAERRLAESWKQVEADDRAAREQMEREEAEHITQAKEDRAKQEAKCIEEQLTPILEFKQNFLASRKQSVPESLVAQEAQEPEVEKTEPRKVDTSVGQAPRHSGEGVEITMPFGGPQVKDPQCTKWTFSKWRINISIHINTSDTTSGKTSRMTSGRIGRRGTISTI